MHDIAFIDETFDINLTHSYELSIQVTLNGFSFCIMDSVRSKCIGFAFYKMDENAPFDDILSHIENILNDNLSDYTRYKFKKVKCIYHSPRYTLVPQELFDKDKMHEYFKFSNYIEELDEINFNFIPSLDSYIIFTMPSSLSNLLIQKFENISFYNHITAFIRNIATNTISGQNRVFINTDNGHLDIVAIKNDEFQLINSFPFDNEKDASYYILNIYEQLKLDQNNTPLYYSGANEKLSLLLIELKTFIGQSKQNKLSEEYSFSYQFNKIKKHQFANLLSTFQCE